MFTIFYTKKTYLGLKSRDQATVAADTLYICPTPSPAVAVAGGGVSEVRVHQRSEKETVITLERKKETKKKKKDDSVNSSAGKDWSQVIAEGEDSESEFVPKFPEILCRGEVILLVSFIRK